MAKIETLVDNFTGGLTNWTNLPSPYDTDQFWTDSGSAFTCDLNPSVTSAMFTAVDCTFQNTWITLELTQYNNYTGGTAPAVFELAIYKSDLSANFGVFEIFSDYQMGVGYNKGWVTIFDGTSGTPVSVAHTGNLLLGWREDSGNCGSFYSLDGGTTWTFIAGGPDTIDGAGYRLVVLGQGSGDAVSQVVTGTNLNAVAPPALPPMGMNIAVPTFTVAAAMGHVSPGILVPTMHAHAHMIPPTIIFNDLHIGDRATNPHFQAHAALPVTGASVTLGITTHIPSPMTAHAAMLPYTGIIYGPPTFLLAPANVTIRMLAPSITLSAPSPTIAVPTMGVVADMVDGLRPILHTGAIVPGDHTSYPINITGVEGSLTIDMSTVGDFNAPDDNPPAGSYFTSPNGSLWLTYTTASEMHLTITLTLPSGGTVSYVLNAMTGTAGRSDLGITPNWQGVLQMGTSGYNPDTTHFGPYVSGNTATLAVDPGQTWFFLSTLDSGVTDHHVTLSWSAVPVVTGLAMQVKTPTLETAPGNVQVSVQGGTPSEPFKFQWAPPSSTLIPSSIPRPITLATIKSDVEGNLFVGTLPIPVCYAGTYEIVCTGTQSGKGTTGTFTVANNPLTQDLANEDATPVAQSGTKWLWDDGRGTTWSMLINPTTASTTIPQKVLLNDRTTSGAGQNILWQGNQTATQWTFSGSLLAQSEYNNFQWFFALNRKFYITDHRGTTRVVTLKSFDPTPKKDAFSNPWAMDYQATALVYKTVGGID